VGLFFSNPFGVSNHRKIEIELCPVDGFIPRGWLVNKTKGDHEKKNESEHMFDSEGVAGL
jgi:hypothetical protein